MDITLITDDGDARQRRRRQRRYLHFDAARYTAPCKSNKHVKRAEVYLFRVLTFRTELLVKINSVVVNRAGWIRPGCFLLGCRVGSGWAGGVAGGQKWVARQQAGWGGGHVGGGSGVREPNTTLHPFNPPVLGGERGGRRACSNSPSYTTTIRQPTTQSGRR